MIAKNIAYTLICSACGHAMTAKQLEKHSQFAYWECLTGYPKDCANRGKLFKQELQDVELIEVEAQ